MASGPEQKIAPIGQCYICDIGVCEVMGSYLPSSLYSGEGFTASSRNEAEGQDWQMTPLEAKVELAPKTSLLLAVHSSSQVRWVVDDIIWRVATPWGMTMQSIGAFRHKRCQVLRDEALSYPDAKGGTVFGSSARCAPEKVVALLEHQGREFKIKKERGASEMRTSRSHKRRSLKKKEDSRYEEEKEKKRRRRR